MMMNMSNSSALSVDYESPVAASNASGLLLPLDPNQTEYYPGGGDWEYPSGYSHLGIVLTSFFVTAIMVLIVVGNMLVCIAIATEKALKTVQNWFIASLAVSDFLVGLVVMPFSLAKEVMGYWIFGDIWCEVHSALDVFLCTASINSLCLISLDRYWSVTQAVEYLRKRTPRRSLAMICGVWVLSAVISLPPLVGWKKPEQPSSYPECLLSDDVGYVLYSAFGSFYVPAVVMVVVYCRIFVAARSRARRHLKKKQRATEMTTAKSTTTTSFSNASPPRHNGAAAAPEIVIEEDDDEPAQTPSTPYVVSDAGSLLRAPRFVKSPFGSTLSLADIDEDAASEAGEETRCLGRRRPAKKKQPPPPPVDDPPPIRPHATEAERHRRRVAKAKERRATLILGLIMASFILAWLPFFVLYVLEALCKACNIGQTAFAVAFWLGYCNSALNPIIYTIFNRDFRRAFRKILFK